MAAFGDLADAVRAVLSIQDELANFNRGRNDVGIVLKLGLHQGACIAVTVGGVLDYFGSAVNTAARIACPRNNRACKRSMGSLWAWQDRHKIMPKWLTLPLFNPVRRTLHLRRQACVLPAKSCTLHRYRDQAETASSLLRNKSLLGSVQ